MSKHAQLRDLLHALENALNAADLWNMPAPSAEDLSSTMPFMCDKISAQAWLRWVMMARFWAILDAGADLPARCDVRDYVEYEWQDYLKTASAADCQLRRDILNILGQIDDCINAK